MLSVRLEDNVDDDDDDDQSVVTKLIIIIIIIIIRLEQDMAENFARCFPRKKNSFSYVKS